VEVTAPLGNSDHSGLEVSIVGMAVEGSTKQEVPDMVAMGEKLGEVEWEEEFGELGGVECMDKFFAVVERVTRECVPMKLRRSGNRPLWMTANIMRMLRRKRRLWRAYTAERYYREDYREFVAYQEVQKELKKQIGKAKRKLEKSLAKKARKNPKNFYSYT
jgi:hypothetical protein